MTDITLPEVKPLQLRARFFRDGNADKVEISAVGTKDTLIKKVGPQEMAQFKAEWDAYCDGKPLVRRPGTPLTDCPNIDQQKADMYIARNIHTLEELAHLSDGQCQGVGHGTMTDRKNAQVLLERRKIEAAASARDRINKASETLGAAPAAPSQSAEITALSEKIDNLANGVSALVGLLTEQAKKRKGGRPPKDKGNAAG